MGKAGRLAGVCVLTFGLAYLCLMLPRGLERVSPVWLANAALLAMLITSRRSAWPAITMAGAAGQALAALAAGDNPLLALALTLANTLEYVGCAFFIVEVLGRRHDQWRVDGLARYALIAAGASVTSGTLATLFIGELARGADLSTFVTWVLADFAGLIVAAPSFVALASQPRWWTALRREPWPLVVLAVAGVTVFVQDRYPLTFIVVPALLLVTWRLGMVGAAVGVLFTLVVSVAGTMLDRGPFALLDGSVIEQMLVLQAFLAVCFYVSLPVAAQAERQARLQADLAAKEARLATLTDHAPDMLVQIDTEDRVVYASPASAQFGYAPGELVGRRRTELVHPEDLARLNAGLVDRLAGRDPAAKERQYRIRRADGEWTWVEGSLSFIRDEAGAIIGGVSLLRDISERRAIQSALAESERRYRALAENVSDILLRFGPDGRVRYMSAAARALGFDPEQAVGRPLSSMVAPDDAEQVERAIALLFSGADAPSSVRGHYRLLDQEGREVWLESSPTLVRDEAGAVVEVVTVLRDVTARREMEAALAESETRFRLIAENVKDLIVENALDGRMTYVSPSCQAMTGYAPDEVLGRTAMDWVYPEDAPALATAFEAQVKGQGNAPTVSVEFRLRTKDGREVWLEARPSAVVDAKTGRVTSVIDVLRDITEHKRLEAELVAARIEAEAAAQAKSDFLANMSHELRTPLTSVVGFNKLAQEQPELSPLTRTYVERVGDASRALLSAVNDILDFSKLEAGQVSFNPEPVALRPLARAALELFQPQAGAKDLTLEADIADDVTVLVDPDRLRQVLLNLIGNAVKFTEAGGVTLTVGYDEAAGRLNVAVRDTGAGIPAEKLDRLFKRFSQVDGSLTRTGGTGLGLAICKGIVEAMGGEIGVTSAEGEGSTFAFSAPAPRVEAAAARESAGGTEMAVFAGVRVLVADDHPANRELVNLFLAGVGAEVTEAEDGEQAAELAEALPYDVILMDLRMPRMDGMAALKRIRERPGPNDMTPVLAFTADAEPTLHERLATLGFQGVVAKPVSAAELIAAVAEATSFVHPETHFAELG